MNSNQFKIFLAILLFLCLIDMPYGYYQFVRFTAMMVFTYLAYTANQKGFKNEFWVYVALTVLFQPFIKIAFGRELWNIIDVIVGVGLLATSFKKNT